MGTTGMLLKLKAHILCILVNSLTTTTVTQTIIWVAMHLNRWINIALYYKPFVSRSAQIWPVRNNRITQFFLPPAQEPYLPLLPNCKASPPFGWYSLCLPIKGWPGWVNLGGWSHTEINFPHRELNSDTVTHLSTNWARCRVTSLMCVMLLPLIWAAEI